MTKSRAFIYNKAQSNLTASSANSLAQFIDQDKSVVLLLCLSAFLKLFKKSRRGILRNRNISITFSSIAKGSSTKGMTGRKQIGIFLRLICSDIRFEAGP